MILRLCRVKLREINDDCAGGAVNGQEQPQERLTAGVSKSKSGIVERVSLSILLHQLYRFATPATPQHERLPSEPRLARFMKCRQRLGPRRGSSAADRRARRATAVRRWGFELPPP